METVGNERLRASQCLKQVEESALLLENLLKSEDVKKISPGFPRRLSTILNALTSITSRDDGERLLASGKLHIPLLNCRP